ncbi:MAG: J domain-containing protein [Ignavibacteriaceae bacterium]|nr:J domain-containing protein [Ignavibacteriaceae bacterium]
MDRDKLIYLKSEADFLFNSDRYTEAYTSYQFLTDEILRALNETKFSRKVSKGAGWVAAVLTGGIGFEDLLVVPVVNKIVMGLFGINLDELLSMLQSATLNKQFCLLSAPVLRATAKREEVLRDYLIMYKIMNRNEENTWFNSLMDLINPFSDTSKISGQEFLLTEKQLLQGIYEELLRLGNRTDSIHDVLFAYLVGEGLNDNKVYEYLKAGREKYERMKGENFSYGSGSSYGGYKQSSYSGNSSSYGRSTGGSSSGNRTNPGRGDEDKVKFYSEILELNGDLTPENIRKKYREKMKEFHPDLVQNLPPEMQKFAEKMSKKLNEAYNFFKQRFGFN